MQNAQNAPDLVKFSDKLKKLAGKLQKGYIDDITKIVHNISNDFDIYYKETNTKVDMNIILNRFIDVFSTNDEFIICKGISQNGNKCLRRASETGYCKTHNYLFYKETRTSSSLYLIDEKKTMTPTSEYQTFTKKFIQDTFYYIDHNYIYDINTKEKVGYIERDTQNDIEYILTDDPFILSACLD